MASLNMPKVDSSRRYLGVPTYLSVYLNPRDADEVRKTVVFNGGSLVSDPLAAKTIVIPDQMDVSLLKNINGRIPPTIGVITMTDFIDRALFDTIEDDLKFAEFVKKFQHLYFRNKPPRKISSDDALHIVAPLPRKPVMYTPDQIKAMQARVQAMRQERRTHMPYETAGASFATMVKPSKYIPQPMSALDLEAFRKQIRADRKAIREGLMEEEEEEPEPILKSGVYRKGAPLPPPGEERLAYLQKKFGSKMPKKRTTKKPGVTRKKAAPKKKND